MTWEEKLEAISNCFYDYNIFYVENNRDGSYYVTVSNETEYVKFSDGLSTLKAYLKIAEILECTNGDEVERVFYPEEPSWTASDMYEIKLKFW